MKQNMNDEKHCYFSKESKEKLGKISRRIFVSGGLAAAGSLFFLGSVSEQVSAKDALKIDFAALKKDFKFKGEVYLPKDDGFKKTAFGGLWNKLQPKRSPQVIAVVADEADVQAAVKFAVANKLKICVRGGGHNWCAPSLRNSGILVDLSKLNKIISIDAKNKKAVLQPVISNRQVQLELNKQGLSFPSGHCPPVKLSGYLLSGGMSWNQGVWGPGCYSVEAIEMVNAKGEAITADAKQNSDYFWAARGAGPGLFAVCTRYHLKLYSLPKAISWSSYFYPYDKIVEVAAWLAPTASKLPANVELSLFAVTAPDDLKEKCKANKGKVAMVTATIFADTLEEAKQSVKPLDSCPLLSKALKTNPVEPASFPQLFDASGDLWPEGLRCKVDAVFSNKSVAELFKATKDHFLDAPAKTVLMFAVFTGKNVPAPLRADAAFSMSARNYGGPWTMWENPKDDRESIVWHEKCVELLKPLLSGHYVSETDTVGHPDYVKASYKEANYKRLQELRKKHDPTGVFFDFNEGLS